MLAKGTAVAAKGGAAAAKGAGAAAAKGAGAAVKGAGMVAKKAGGEVVKGVGKEAATETAKQSLFKEVGKQFLNSALQGDHTKDPNTRLAQSMISNMFGVGKAEAAQMPPGQAQPQQQPGRSVTEVPQQYKNVVVPGPGGMPIKGAGEALPSSIPQQYQQYGRPQRPMPGAMPPSQPGIWSKIAQGAGQAGKGMLEGTLGMPQTGKSIPYYAGKMPGDIVRSRIGVPTAGKERYNQMVQQYYEQGTPIVDEYGRPVMTPGTDMPARKPYKGTTKKEPKVTETQQFRSGLQEANDAIKSGADKDAVMQRLKEEFPDKAKDIQMLQMWM
jgi:hypothetical protein